MGTMIFGIPSIGRQIAKNISQLLFGSEKNCIKPQLQNAWSVSLRHLREAPKHKHKGFESLDLERASSHHRAHPDQHL